MVSNIYLANRQPAVADFEERTEKPMCGAKLIDKMVTSNRIRCNETVNTLAKQIDCDRMGCSKEIITF